MDVEDQSKDEPRERERESSQMKKASKGVDSTLEICNK